MKSVGNKRLLMLQASEALVPAEVPLLALGCSGEDEALGLASASIVGECAAICARIWRMSPCGWLFERLSTTLPRLDDRESAVAEVINEIISVKMS